MRFEEYLRLRQELHDMHQRGVLSDDEFARDSARLDQLVSSDRPAVSEAAERNVAEYSRQRSITDAAQRLESLRSGVAAATLAAAIWTVISTVAVLTDLVGDPGFRDYVVALALAAGPWLALTGALWTGDRVLSGQIRILEYVSEEG